MREGQHLSAHGLNHIRHLPHRWLGQLLRPISRSGLVSYMGGITFLLPSLLLLLTQVINLNLSRQERREGFPGLLINQPRLGW